MQGAYFLKFTVEMLKLVTYLNRTLIYLSGIWFGVAPQIDTKKTHV